MDRPTQKQLIVKFLKDVRQVDWGAGWVRAYHLRGKDTKWGFLGHQSDRRARELFRDGKVEHRISDGFAEYRYKEPIETQMTSEEILRFSAS